MAADRETSIRRGLDVLFALARPDAIQAGGLGVMQICEITGREKSQVSRSLKILADYGLVDRDPRTLAYRLGWRLFALAQLAGDRRLLDDAGPVLERLVRDCGESAVLSVRRDREAITVLAHQPEAGLQASARVGQASPLAISSAGRVLLGALDEERLRGMFSDFGERDDLVARVFQAARAGYCMADDEFDPGMLSVAAPVLDVRGEVCAAVSVSGPSFRLRDRADDIVAAVRAAATSLSQFDRNHDLRRFALPGA